MNAIELKKLSFKYEGANDYVLKDVSFALKEGEIGLIYGYSGAGKSTLLSLISGIIPNIIAGEVLGDVFINNKSIKGKKVEEVTRLVSLVLQNPDEQIIYPLVKDELIFTLENFGVDPKIMDQKIEEVSNLLLLDINKETKKLSGGEKQKLIIASALLTNNKLILLDEPFANIDKKTVDTLLKVFLTLKEKGYTILIIEHRLDLLLNYASCFYHLADKTIKETSKDEAKEIFKNQILPSIPSSPSKEVIFKVNNINFIKRKEVILENINFDIHKGEKLLILGDNGAGKTTLLNIIGRLKKQTSGKVYQFIDKSFKAKTHGNKKWFNRVGIIYQNPSYQLFLDSVKDEIYFNAYSEEYALKIINKFKFESLLSRNPLSLSQGEKRRVTIASIMATKPEVVLLDEPTVGQDYEFLKELVNVLNEIHKETNNTMITITHDKRCALALADRAIFLKDHRIDKIGNLEDIKSYFNI